MSGYFLRLDYFEGPLDLLLHLIKVSEIDIFNIDIFKLSKQYIEHLRVLDFDDLGHAGEFLEMAAALVEIKAKMLLPVETKSNDNEESDLEDPRKSLQDRLLQYERTRAAAECLSSRFQNNPGTRPSQEWQRLEPLYCSIESPLIGDTASLVVLFEQLMRRLAERKPPAKVEATTELISVEEKIVEIEKILATSEFVLFQGFYKLFKTRYELVVYLLAVLELVKFQKIKVFQQDLNGPLWLFRSDVDAKILRGRIGEVKKPDVQHEAAIQ